MPLTAPSPLAPTDKKKKDDDSYEEIDRNDEGSGGTIIFTPTNPNSVQVSPGVWITKAPPTPVPIAPQPTNPPPTTAAPVSASPTTLRPITSAPTAKATPDATPKPSSAVLPTPKPTVVTTDAPIAEEVDRTDGRGGSGGVTINTNVVASNPRRWPLDTCSNRPSQPFWEPVVYPEYAQSTQCFFSEGCKETPFSCCLADKCLCGVYRLKSEECVPFIDEMEDRTDGGAGGNVDVIDPDPPSKQGDGNLPLFNTDADTIIDNAYCERPENQQFWDLDLYPDNFSETMCTSGAQCRFIPNTCCLASKCLCGEYQPETMEQECV